MDDATIPPCEATGPDGTRVVIRPHATTDSIADLARAFDLPATTTLAIDDRPVAAHERLVTAGLRIGSAVTIAPPDATEPTVAPASAGGVEVAVAVGPACERWITLTPGRHTIGRAATADVRVDDPAVELHHGVLVVDGDGTTTFTQLTGRVRAAVDGVPCPPAHRLTPGCSLSIGSSRLVIGRPATAAAPPTADGSIVPADRDPWRSIVRRGPLPPAGPGPARLEVPEPPPLHRAPPLTALVGACCAAAGAGLLAAVLGQLLFAMFAAVGAVASLATWAVGVLIARRDRRRAERTHRDALIRFEDQLLQAHAAADRAHRARHRSVVDALEAIHGEGPGLWSRRADPSDALWVTIGRGTSRSTPPIADDHRARLSSELLVALDRCERLEDVPVPLALAPSSVVALHGDAALGEALCRSVIIQLAATHGPADWDLQVITDDPERWTWVSWLPHARRRAGVVDAADRSALDRAIDAVDSDSEHRRRTVIVLDAPAHLSARTGPVRRRLARGDATCITLVGPGASVPAVVDRVLELGETGAARWIDTDASVWTAADRDIAIAGLSQATALAAARRLAPLLDPEDHDGIGGLPADVSLAELEPVGEDAATTIARRWKQAGRDPSPIARLGVSGDGVVDIDLVRDGPHALVAGTTGSGKSELLRTMVVSLAAHTAPDHVTMILVDFKGGSTFDACARLPHTVGVVTDLDDGLAERVLVSLDAEVRRREHLLRAARVDDLAAYRRAVDEPLPRLVVVVDEFASLAKELPDFLGALVGIAQRGRSLGIHLVLATQRPAGVVTDDIRANTNLRIALRLQDRADAVDVVGDAGPAGFPIGAPGRAALRLGADAPIVFQTAGSTGAPPVRSTRLRVEPVDAPASPDGTTPTPTASGPSVLDRLVDAICDAAGMVRCAPPHRPWIDALPDVIRPCDLEDPASVGVLDDPAAQCRRQLTWSPTAGNLLLVGAIGAGTTTAAVAVAAACMRAAASGDLHLYVVDAHGDAAWTSFESVAPCGAVVRVAESERLVRLLARLADELDRRSTEGARRPTTVVVIDGFAAVRDGLGDLGHGEHARRLDRLVRDGPSVGIVAVVTTDGVSAAGLAVPRSATWVFHVADRGSARTAGLHAAVVAPGRPGRMRVAESGLEGQVVLDPDPLRGIAPRDATRPGADAPAPVRVLPEVVDAHELETRCPTVRSCSRPSGRPVELLIGLGADRLEPAVLRLPVGDHLFIGGAARTGRSTALRQVEAAWRRVHPGQRVVHVERHRSIGDLDGEVPVLIVADDAERIDDPDGTLAALCSRPGVTLAIAARLEAVRVGYGHWSRVVTRSRCGLIMTSSGDIDGELLGATLPRRPTIAPRPGLAWMIDQDGHRLVQVAARMPP